MFDPRKIIEALNLHEVLGVGSYADAQTHLHPTNLGGLPVQMLDLPTLIRSKEEAADPNPRKHSALECLKTMQRRP